MRKIKIIYILGSGHCGSTLLDLILGSSENAFSTGELSFYNPYIEKKLKKKNANYLCTCKKKIWDCPVWGRISSSHNFNIKKRYSFKENVLITLKILFPSLLQNNEKFVDDTYNLLREVKKVLNNKDVDYFIDSSKDPRRLFYLLSNKNLEVYPIFLKRNGLKVAKSYNKKERIKIGLKRKGFIKSYLVRWAFINYISKKLLRISKNRGLIIQYEDLCNNPKKLVKLFNELYSLKINKNGFLDKLNNKIYHNIDGNDMRFKKIKEIRKQ